MFLERSSCLLYCGNVFAAIKNKKKHCLKLQLGLKVYQFDIMLLRCHGRYSHAELTE